MLLMSYFLSFLCIFFNISSHNYPKPIEGYFSQKGQDKFLNEQVFCGKQNGMFIEIGAHDGISFSNTYYFEKYLNWTGICIEPNPDIFKKLTHNRNCVCEQLCITNCNGAMPFLKCSGYMLEMYSGLLNNYDSRHLDRINKEMAFYGGSKEIIFINCMTFNDLLKKHGINHIDLLSVDIEGGEEKIIKSIDFETFTIDIIVVEDNFNEHKVKDYLLTKGYSYLERIGKDDVFKLERQ